ncbi:cupin domain-containing protein [Haloarchaeobius sp. HRN-SO-5]|uniref:cupin domain-containing protein n=1 Tax=Haloarchaeobius sp. HRN-SO-5 TaxID=3446118 RepID=UPI003EBE23BE
METVSLDDVDPEAVGPDGERRGLSGPLGTTDVACNHYRIPPGEGFPSGLHAHADQEEVFLVLDGEATFETYGLEGDDLAVEGRDGNGQQRLGREVTVSAGEAVRFAPGEFQSGRNDGDDVLVAVALGAPRDSADVRFPLPCPECDHADVRLDPAGGEPAFVCPACDAVRIPEPCPTCGGEDMRVVLDAGLQVAVACRGCGAEFETPPARRP